MVRLGLIVIALIPFAAPTRAATMYQFDGTDNVRNTDAIDSVRYWDWGSRFPAICCTASRRHRLPLLRDSLSLANGGVVMAVAVFRERSHVQFGIAITRAQHNRDVQ